MAVDSTKGNTLIQDKVANMLVEPLTAASVMLSAPGVTVINSSEPVRVPTLSAPIETDWVGENELIPEGDAAFSELELMPTSRKSIKTIVRVSNELIRMATVGVSAVLQNRVVTDVRDKLDSALLAGDGLDDTVTGLINQPGLETAPFDPKDPDTVLDALAFMAANEVTPTRLFMSGADFFEVRKIKDADGRYMLTESITDGARYMLHGVPVTITNKLAAGTAVAAYMPDIALVRDLDPRVTLLSERYADYDQVGIRCVTRYDLGVLRNESVVILKNDAA